MPASFTFKQKETHKKSHDQMLQLINKNLWEYLLSGLTMGIQQAWWPEVGPWLSGLWFVSGIVAMSISQI